MDPHSPHKLFATKYCFSYPEMIRVSFSLFLSFSVFCYFTLLLVFINLFYYYYYYYFFFFHENYFLFFHIQECSGMFRVPGFIDARAIHMHPKIFVSGFFLWPDTAFVHTYPVNTAYGTATFSILPQMLSRVDIF